MFYQFTFNPALQFRFEDSAPVMNSVQLQVTKPEQNQFMDVYKNNYILNEPHLTQSNEKKEKN